MRGRQEEEGDMCTEGTKDRMRLHFHLLITTAQIYLSKLM
jgi:hypothetical protein